MKRFVCVVILILTLSACANNDFVNDSSVANKFKKDIVIEYTEDGEYAGFSDIPNTYTPEDAAEDGCYVVVSSLSVGEKASGLIAGREAWEKFYAESADGKDAFLRVAHYVDGLPYYSDLYHIDGEYRLFELSDETGLRGAIPRKYLLRLTDMINGREAVTYVLTDDTTMTYRDFERTFTSSSMSVISEWGGKFTWLGFTTYLKSGGEHE